MPPGPPSPTFADDEPGVGQDLGVMGDGRLAPPEWGLELAGADLVRGGNQGEQAQSDGVGQGPERTGQLFGLLR